MKRTDLPLNTAIAKEVCAFAPEICGRDAQTSR
jgi:hypothetical protein